MAKNQNLIIALVILFLVVFALKPDFLGTIFETNDLYDVNAEYSPSGIYDYRKSSAGDYTICNVCQQSWTVYSGADLSFTVIPRKFTTIDGIKYVEGPVKISYEVGPKNNIKFYKKIGSQLSCSGSNCIGESYSSIDSGMFTVANMGEVLPEVSMYNYGTASWSNYGPLGNEYCPEGVYCCTSSPCVIGFNSGVASLIPNGVINVVECVSDAKCGEGFVCQNFACVEGPLGTVEILKPLENEIIDMGQQYKIEWTTTGITTTDYNFGIEYKKVGDATWEFITQVPYLSTAFYWDIPYLPEGNYELKVQARTLAPELSPLAEDIVTVELTGVAPECIEGEKVYYGCDIGFKEDYFLEKECINGVWEFTTVIPCECHNDLPCKDAFECNLDINVCELKPNITEGYKIVNNECIFTTNVNEIEYLTLAECEADLVECTTDSECGPQNVCLPSYCSDGKCIDISHIILLDVPTCPDGTEAVWKDYPDCQYECDDVPIEIECYSSADCGLQEICKNPGTEESRCVAQVFVTKVPWYVWLIGGIILFMLFMGRRK